ncbi:MAG: betaine--homocysteine S-methyltransferase [Pannonibacter sp.]
MSKLETLLAEKGVLLADGATGTNLFQMGLTSGDAPELWNVDEPEKIKALHRAFVEAGADILLTNTFGANRHRMKLHKAEDRVVELNAAAARLARAVADEVEREVLIAGSIGPTGELLAPLGALTYEGAVAAFAEQIEGLKAGGVDILWAETMSAPEEMQAAAEAANGSGLPLVISASFDTAGRTMMGLTPKALTEVTSTFACTPTVVGANCGVGASDLLATILQLSEANPEAIILAKGNCGIPVIQGDKVVYSGTPELMETYAHMALNAGARIVGGCCGTSPLHLAAMRKALDRHTPGPRPTLEDIIRDIGPLVSPPNENAGEGRGGEGRRGRRRG